MKKFTLTKQFIFIFVLVLFITTSFFSTLLISKLSKVSETVNYDRLELFIDTTSPLWNTDPKLMFEKYQNNFNEQDFGFIVGSNTNDYYVTNNLLSYLRQDEIQEMVDDFHLHHNFSRENVVKQRMPSEKGIIYVVFSISSNGNFIITSSNNTYVRNLKNTTGFDLISIFFVVLIIGTSIIVWWSRDITKRIQAIKKHVDEMNNDSYAVTYKDEGFDEISLLSDSIEEMRKTIHENESTKQDMLQNISHDFKTPIAVIKSYAEAISDGVEDVKSTRIIIEQCDLLRNKVVKLLQYNRLEYLTKDKEFEDVAIKSIINEVVMNYKHRVNINIITKLDDSTFKGYRENYYTVIDNILDNATRFAKTKIVITLKYNILRIYNDGEPIDEQFLNASFKPYEKGSKGQFGLGMSIVKRTLDFFDMKLEVRNEVVGVTFLIKSKDNNLI